MASQTPSQDLLAQQVATIVLNTPALAEKFAQEELEKQAKKLAQKELEKQCFCEELKVSAKRKMISLLEKTKEKHTIVIFAYNQRFLIPTGEHFIPSRNPPREEEAGGQPEHESRHIFSSQDEAHCLTAHTLDKWVKNTFEELASGWSVAGVEGPEEELVSTGEYEIANLDEPYVDIFPFGDAPCPPRPRRTLLASDTKSTFTSLGFCRTQHMIIVNQRVHSHEKQKYISSRVAEIDKLMVHDTPASSPRSSAVSLASNFQPLIMRLDVVEIRICNDGADQEDAIKFNGKRAIVEDVQISSDGESFVDVKIPLLNNLRRTFSVHDVRRLDDCPFFEHDDELLAALAVETGADAGGAEDARAAASELLDKLRAAHDNGTAASDARNKLRSAVTRAKELLNRRCVGAKDPSDPGVTAASSTTENETNYFLRGKVRNQLKKAVHFAEHRIVLASEKPSECENKQDEAVSGRDSRVARLSTYKNCYTEERHDQLLQFIADVRDRREKDEDECRRLRRQCKLPDTKSSRISSLVPGSLGKMTTQKSLAHSLSTVLLRCVRRFKHIHVPGSTCDDFLLENEETRRILFQIGWLFEFLGREPKHDKAGRRLFLLRALAVSFFAQAVPDVIADRLQWCVPCSVYSSREGTDESWLYLFWHPSSGPIVTFMQLPTPSSSDKDTQCWSSARQDMHKFLHTDRVPLYDVGNRSMTVDAGVGKKKKKKHQKHDDDPLCDDTVLCGFLASIKPFQQSFVEIETGSFLAVEVVDFQEFITAGKRNCKMLSVLGTAAKRLEEREGPLSETEKEQLHAEIIADLSNHQYHFAQAHILFGNRNEVSGMRKQFLSRTNTAEEIAFFGKRDENGALLDKTDYDVGWNLKRMHWLTAMGERRQRACFGALFHGAGSCGPCSSAPGFSHAFHPHASASPQWIVLGDSTPLDQQIITALEEYLVQNSLLGFVDQNRRCITGHIPFALPVPEDPMDKYLENLFWSDIDDDGAPASRTVGAEDLNAAELVQAALIGWDDPEALEQVLGDCSQSLFGPELDCLQTEAAALIKQGLDDKLRDLHVQAAEHLVPKAKIKTRGEAGKFNLHTARDRARKFREAWEENNGEDADEATGRSVRKCGLRWVDANSSAGASKVVDTAPSGLGSADGAGSSNYIEDDRLERVRAVLNVLAQKRMKWRQTKRGLHLLRRVGVIGIDTDPESGVKQLRLNTRGSHQILHGPGGAATLVRDHKGSAPLTGRQFVESMKKVAEIGVDSDQSKIGGS
ncbi:unnamed protein product [Amoebophrya sp. A120]|nr:unnamed protein product [Amoebophrya sp. A120]|eukprot:GSA120T00010800001.1